VKTTAGLCVLVAGLAAALAFPLAWPTLLVDDSSSYLVPARSWAAGDGLQEGGRPLESRLPAYPFVLGLVIRAGGDDVRWFGVANAAFHVAGMLLVASLLRRRAPGLVYAVCGLALAYPPFLTATGMVLQESLIAFLLAGVMVLGWKALESASSALAFFTGLALGLAALAKVTALPLIVPLSGIVAAAGPQRVRRIVLLWLGTMLAIAPWMVRNARETGRFEITNNNGGLATFGGTVSNEIADWYRFPEYLAARDAWMAENIGTEASLDRAFYGLAARRIAADPGRWLVLVGERVLRFMLPARHWFFQTGRSRPATVGPWYLAAIVVQGALFASAVLVVVRTWRGRGPWAHLLPPLIVFNHLALYAVSYASPRYNVTVAPALVACLLLALTRERAPSPPQPS
jgi:hypothetical protein